MSEHRPPTEHGIAAITAGGADLVAEIHGAKAVGLQQLLRLGLPVPPAIVIPVDLATELAVSAASGLLAEGRDDLGVALAGLEPARHGVSVRSGAAISLPGVFATVLHVPATVAAVIAAVADVEASTRGPQVEPIVAALGLEEVPPTAVIVQVMVDGGADDRSGAGVATSRDPVTGEPGPAGSVAWSTSGAAVMQGSVPVRPLAELADRVPEAAARLTADLARLDEELGQPVEVEFTVEAGRLWYLQLRTHEPPAAASDPGEPPAGELLAEGRPASAGIGVGLLFVDVDAALERIDAGDEVVVALETSSPGEITVKVGAAAVLTVLGSP